MSKHGDVYREIPMTIWDREDFRDLSVNAKAIVLYLFMLTGPLSIRVPGIFRAGKATITEGLRWPLEMFEEALVELETRKMVIADWRAPLVWMPGELNEFNRPKNPSHATGWRNALRLLPDCDLKVRAVEAIETFLVLHGYPAHRLDTVSTPSRHTTATASDVSSNHENGSKVTTLASEDLTDYLANVGDCLKCGGHHDLRFDRCPRHPKTYCGVQGCSCSERRKEASRRKA